MVNETLTAISGMRVGHVTHEVGATGCTVILCPEGTVAGVDQRGGAPGTRETDLLHPMHLVETVNAIVLSGGSAYGLAAADGVMQYCEDNGLGYPTGTGFIVPIVPAAILMDLPVGEPGIRPDAAMGYAACEAASDMPVVQGSVGAGTGCRIGAFRGNDYATKGGIGSARVDIGSGIMVTALIAVNAVGDVIAEDGTILAGMRDDAGGYANMLEMMRGMVGFSTPPRAENTVIGVVATNARLDKAEACKVAQMAHNGIARAVRPAHTMWDGDTLFTLATGEHPANVSVVGAFAAEAVTLAIRQAVRHATSVGGVRAANA